MDNLHRGVAGQPAKQYAAHRIPDHHDPVERRGRQHHRSTFVVIDNQGNTVGNKTISLSNQPAQNLAPIVAFQLNFVGDIGGNTTILSSGAGTMTYTASNLMS